MSRIVVRPNVLVRQANAVGLLEQPGLCGVCVTSADPGRLTCQQLPGRTVVDIPAGPEQPMAKRMVALTLPGMSPGHRGRSTLTVPMA